VTRDGQPSGTLNPAQQGQPTIRWDTPTQTGRDTVTVTASDGRGGTTTLVETILVGTLKTSRIQFFTQETWSMGDSPFIIQPVEDKFVIDEGAGLTVDAGCQLLVNREDLEISVVGILRTNGTAQAPVVIRPNSRKPDPGYWLGITASPSGQAPPVVRLFHTDVLYAEEAVKAVTSAQVFLDGCRVMFSSDAAVLHWSSGNLQVLNSAITNNSKTGIRIIRGTATPLPWDPVVISGDSIATNGDDTGQLTYTDQAAIYIDVDDGGDIDISTIDINHNEISRNYLPGIQLARASYPKIHDNSIFSNELKKKTDPKYNIKLDNNVGGSRETIDARQNHWGEGFTNPATDSLLIKQMIRDSEDSATITARVLIYPWLNVWPPSHN
jgi:parallel beta-helix repeat protein